MQPDRPPYLYLLHYIGDDDPQGDELVAIFLDRAVAERYMAAHADYHDGDDWGWVLEQWQADDGPEAIYDGDGAPYWRELTAEAEARFHGTVADGPPADWPYRWAYTREGAFLAHTSRRDWAA